MPTIFFKCFTVFDLMYINGYFEKTIHLQLQLMLKYDHNKEKKHNTTYIFDSTKNANFTRKCSIRITLICVGICSRGLYLLCNILNCLIIFSNILH